jgi:hypothetical protein
VYQVFRHLYQANPANNPDFFSVSEGRFHAGAAEADMKCSEAELVDALAAEKGNIPSISHDELAQSYPALYQSLLQLVHGTGERVNALLGTRK